MDFKRSCKWVWCFGRRLLVRGHVVCLRCAWIFFAHLFDNLWGAPRLCRSALGFWWLRLLERAGVECLLRLWNLTYFLSILRRANVVCQRNWNRCIFQLLMLSTKKWLEKLFNYVSPDLRCILNSICLLFHDRDNAKSQAWYKWAKLIVTTGGYHCALIFSLLCFTVIHGLVNLCHSEWL